MAVTTIIPYFGSNRMLAHHVGELLQGCSWVGVPFLGGGCELAHIKARTIVANDLHRHVVNLARTIADPVMGPQLYRRLRRAVFHPDTLAKAQAFCKDVGDTADPLAWAEAYFISAWMGRNGRAGTKGEFANGISIRWEPAGGDSVVRFQSAVRGLTSWRRVLRRATFVCLDVFKFLEKCKDRNKHGIYCDPPFFGPGEAYRHTLTKEQHQQLAAALSAYQHTRVVCRFYDVPLVRELYPEPLWHWHHLVGRKQTNDLAPEVLLVKN